MPRGDKSKYTDKQKRRAEHIEKGYEARGMSESEAGRRAWMTVNAIHGGGEKRSGSGYGKAENHEPMRRGGRKGGKAAAGRKKTTARKGTARNTASRKSASTRRASSARKTSPARKTASARKATGARKKTSTRSSAARKGAAKKR